MLIVVDVFPTVLMCMFMLLKVVLITAEGYQLGFSREKCNQSMVVLLTTLILPTYYCATIPRPLHDTPDIHERIHIV